jgi:hypothetical protein
MKDHPLCRLRMVVASVVLPSILADLGRWKMGPPMRALQEDCWGYRRSTAKGDYRQYHSRRKGHSPSCRDQEDSLELRANLAACSPALEVVYAALASLAQDPLSPKFPFRILTFGAAAMRPSRFTQHHQLRQPQNPKGNVERQRKTMQKVTTIVPVAPPPLEGNALRRTLTTITISMSLDPS